MQEDNQIPPQEQLSSMEANNPEGPAFHPAGEPQDGQGFPQEVEQSGSRFSGVARFALDLLETLVLSLVLFLAINIVIARIRVESISMEPTLYPGEFIVVNKLAYHSGGYQRGDVIIFKPPNDPHQQYIKRVIGLSGEEVVISGGKVYINGNPLEEPYIMSPPMYTEKWEVPQGSLFVLGDNRNRSSDSHVWGMVPFNDIIGKALFIYWPFNRMGAIAGLPGS